MIIVMSNRACFESDLEVIRVCHKWGTRIQIVRTKFDVDLRSFVLDHPEKIQELSEQGKCTGREIAKLLRADISEELTKSLLKQGIYYIFFGGPGDPAHFLSTLNGKLFSDKTWNY